MPIAQQFCQHAKANPDQVALVIGSNKYTYAFLAEEASKVAAWLWRHNINRLGILTNRSISNYVGILACLWLGRTYVPINSKLPPKRINEIKQSSRLDAVFETEYSYLSNGIECLTIQKENSMQSVYIMFTSGSTGLPKGVPVSYATLNHFISTVQEHYQLNSDDRVAQYADLSFDMSVYDVLMAWNAGATLYVIPEAQRLAPAQFIRENRISVWFSVPSVIKIMHKLGVLKPNSLPSLRISLFSGEALTNGDADLWQQAASNSIVDNLYGPTEATVECLWQRFNRKQFLNLNKQAVLPIGKPFLGNIVALLDESNQWLGRNQPGELVIAGPQVVLGYWKNEPLTQQKFISLNHPRYGRHRWYRTADKAYQDEEGVFYYLGRLDNQVKVRGNRVELDEVEYYLRRISGCDEVASLVKKNDLGDLLYGIVVDSTLDERSIKTRMQQFLPDYMVPERIISVAQLPYNLNGKLDRKKLLDLVP